MKRLLLSVACGFLIPFCYIIITRPLSTYVENHHLLFLLDLPTGWPRSLIFRYCSPRCPLDGGATLFVIIIASNVALYGTLTYFVLWLRSLRKPKVYATPPPPNL